MTQGWRGGVTLEVLKKFTTFSKTALISLNVTDTFWVGLGDVEQVGRVLEVGWDTERTWLQLLNCALIAHSVLIGHLYRPLEVFKMCLWARWAHKSGEHLGSGQPLGSGLPLGSG